MLKTTDIGKTLPAKIPTTKGVENEYDIRYEGTCQRVNNSELRSTAGNALGTLDGC